jgi:hypothetical protein
MSEILSNEISHHVERIPLTSDIQPIFSREKKDDFMIKM